MFESVRNFFTQAVDSVQEKYQGFTDSVDRFNQDMVEIRDTFVSAKNVVSAVFSFIGQETAILLFLTFLFLFVFNMIPFLFFDKKVRYYIGVAFGVFLSFSFHYALWSLIKYILIMFAPVILEYLLVKLFKLAGKTSGGVLKKAFQAVTGGAAAIWRKFSKKREKEPEEPAVDAIKDSVDEKQVLK